MVGYRLVSEDSRDRLSRNSHACCVSQSVSQHHSALMFLCLYLRLSFWGDTMIVILPSSLRILPEGDSILRGLSFVLDSRIV